MEKNKVFPSLEEWEKEYLPARLRQKKYEAFREDPKSVGIALAKESLDKLKVELTE